MPDPNPLQGLYPQPQQQQSSLLANPVGTVSSILQLQQLQRALAAKQAVGQAFQGAIGPDGNFDPNAAFAGIKVSPAAAWGAPEAIGSILDYRGKNIANATAQLGLGLTNNEGAARITAPYAALGRPLTQEEQYNLKAQLAAAGINPATVQAADLNGSIKAAKAATLGAIQTMGPAAAATPVTGAPQPGTGAPTQVPLSSTIGAGARVTGTPPGTEVSATAMQNDLLREANYGQEIYPLKAALSSLQALGPGGIGPGTEGRNKFESFLNTIAPSLAQYLPGFDPTKIKNYDEFTKYVTQATQQRAASMGGAHTDAQLATTLTGSPNNKINDLAAEDVLKANIALRNMQRVQTLEAAQAGPVGYTAKASTFAGTQDPRAYLVPYLSPA